MKKIYAILPCYNEEENIGKLIEEWNKQTEKLKEKEYDLNVIAIDDCSKDNTQKVILEKKDKYTNVDIIIHEENKGLCGGLNSALKYFNQNGNEGDLLVLMDGDNTHDPKYIHEMLGLLNNGKDCVIASRYRKGSNIVGLAKNRELMSDLAKIYYSAILRIPNVRDYTCGYRVYTYDIINKLLQKFGENPIKEKSFACMMELLYKVYSVGAKFDEVGFELRYDNKIGESKMKVFNTAKRSMITALKLKFDKNMIFSILCGIFIMAFSIFLSLATNYSPMNANILSHDCGIFSYIAWAMQKGRVLYVEAWENKGPLLYFIYYIGLNINKTYGIYILELISIFISVLYCYKTLNIITNKKIYSILGVIYTFSVYGITYEGGTFSETFALPFMCIGIYLFAKKIFNGEKTKNIEIVLWGILTGAIGILRLNMLSIFLAFFLVIGIDLIIKKEFKEIFRWIGLGILGVFIPILPIAIYLIFNNAVMACINSAYLNIMSGFNPGTLKDIFECVRDMLIVFNVTYASIIMGIFVAISIILIANKKIKDKKILQYVIAVVLATIINLYANSIAGAFQMHYFITFIPIMCMISGLIINEYTKTNINKILKYLILAIVIFIISKTGYTYYIEFYNAKKAAVAEGTQYVQIEKYINNNTNEDDLVQMIGGRMEAVSANFRTQRLSASKYSYLPLWSTFTTERKKDMTNECVREIEEKIPKLIFVCQYNNNENEFNSLIDEKEKWDSFIKENYEKDSESIYLYTIYKRKV